MHLKNRFVVKSASLRSLINLLFAAIIFSGLGCAKLDVAEAFKGNFEKSKNNKIINDYCKSCHIHKDFDSIEHIPEKQTDYKRVVFNKAEECRICHFVEKKIVYNRFLRKTRRPADANRGKYKDFEKKEIKKMKNLRKRKTSVKKDSKPL